MRGWTALILVLLLVGCTRPAAPEEEAPEMRANRPSARDAAALGATPVAPAVPDLAVALVLADTWIRPAEMVLANASATASSFEWYLAPRNPLATLPDAGPFALAPTGAVALGTREPGRHAFALDGSKARLNVSIVADAIALRLEARIVEEDDVFRFAPEELVGGAGSVVRVVNGASSPVSLHRVESMMPLAAEGVSIAFMMPTGIELGDYDVVVVARDGAGAVGEASARVIYDSRKPDLERTFGPFSGSFQAPPVRDPEPARYAWTSEHPLRTLGVALSFSTEAPVPAALRVTLVGPDDLSRTLEGDTLALTDLPAGDYALLVEHVEGALIEYRLDVEGVWKLVPPTTFFSR